MSRRLVTPLFLFAVATLLMGLNAGLYDPSFNNYLSQVHQVSEVARGALEFPREFPGFLTVFIFSLLAFLPDTRIALLAAFLVGISLWGQGYLAPNINSVVVWMLIWSTGSHLFMVLKSAIALRMAEEGKAGTLLGRLGALEAGGSLVGMLVVYWGVSSFNFSFGVIFGIAGTCALIAALSLFLIKPQPIKTPRQPLLLKKKYSLYYILNILFGARKQIFLTFAPWVLIQMFNCGVETFALLGLIGTIVSLAFRPLLGIAIDVLGEKIILISEAIIIMGICILYGFAPKWFGTEIAITIIFVCFIIDQVLFAVSMARTTYLNRIADKPEDVAPTLSMGLTLDHAVSMLVPFGGGLLWAAFGYEWVFIVAAGIALVSLFFAFLVPDLADKKSPA
ncbi:MAG TPA: MFS transporter [Syntrophomonadaceae bacterium]|nr:MFS transporter [Syntrophomonadaceae bacterium]